MPIYAKIMHQKKQYTIDEALDYIASHSAERERPILVAVCGMPNSGKSFFQSRARERFPNTGITASHDTPHAYKTVQSLDYLIIHAACVSSPNEVSEQTRKYVGKGIDFSVYMYHPQRNNVDIKRLLGEFDLVITNPQAKVK